MEWNTILSYQTIEKELLYFKQFEPKSIISLIGGEPTLHPKFNKILELMQDFNHYCHVYTNGTKTNFKNINLKLAKKFKWTFSYHGEYTAENFYTNLEWFYNNKIDVNVTCIAQNLNETLIKFVNERRIELTITFIHDTKNNSNFIPFSKEIYDISGPNIINLSKYYKAEISGCGKSCNYREIDITQSRLISNKCNLNKNEEFTLSSLLSISPYTNICKIDKCPNDCAFLIPNIGNFL
jgi:MoaA/NifB/PqqE/SkfB family radical SAM enzyme